MTPLRVFGALLAGIGSIVASTLYWRRYGPRAIGVDGRVSRMRDSGAL